MLKTVTAPEANRSFSEISRVVSKGCTVIITEHGEPCIQMKCVDKVMLEPEEARRALLERLDTREGIKRLSSTRNELSDDDVERTLRTTPPCFLDGDRSGRESIRTMGRNGRSVRGQCRLPTSSVGRQASRNQPGERDRRRSLPGSRSSPADSRVS